MAPFVKSLTARLLCAAAFFGLVGGGLVPVLGLAPGLAAGVLTLLVGGLGFVALILGARKYTGPVILLSALAPVGFFSYSLGLTVIVERHPSYSWVLFALGGVTACLLIASFGLRDESQPKAVPIRASVGASAA